MNTKHTPGPWTADGRSIKHYKDNGYTLIARVGGYLPSPLDESNARLIAKAPELLTALRWALDNMGDDLDPDHQEAKQHATNLVNSL
jgi:hypothetical protein